MGARTVIPRKPALRGFAVLLYHDIGHFAGVHVPQKKRFSVTPSQFRGHLEEVRRLNYRISLLGQLWTSNDLSDWHRSAVVSFDDGRASDYIYAFPSLANVQSRAEFFVNTSTIGRSGFLSWSQVREMHSHGMSFQSHSHDHVDLSRLSTTALKMQLIQSKEILQHHLGCSVDFLAVPYGEVNSRVVGEAEQAGYQAVCTSRSWPAQPKRNTIARAAVYGHTSLAEFRSLIMRLPSVYLRRAARSMVLSLPKRFLLTYCPQTVSNWRGSQI